MDEARHKLAAERFELVLCDITMAGESGSNSFGPSPATRPDTVVVMVTGSDDPQIAEQAVALGVYGYLVKPFTSNEVLITVAAALRRRELELERKHWTSTRASCASSPTGSASAATCTTT